MMNYNRSHVNMTSTFTNRKNSLKGNSSIHHDHEALKPISTMDPWAQKNKNFFLPYLPIITLKRNPLKKAQQNNLFSRRERKIGRER